jgi:diguanylate cyclase (GGDEF)-like protein
MLRAVRVPGLRGTVVDMIDKTVETEVSSADAAPPRPRLMDRLVAGRPPQCLGRVLLLLVVAIGITAHTPRCAPAATVLGLVVTLLAALWTQGAGGYLSVAAVQLVQLPVPLTNGGLVVTGVATGTALALVRLVRALMSMVSEAQHASVQHHGARNELVRKAKSEQDSLAGQVTYWATHDRLTEVYNRTALNQQLTDAAAARRPTGILVITLAGFSAINESLGADVGDECLAALAARLSTHARESDMVGRLGGDEFAVILPGLAHDHADTVARRLHELLRDPFTVGPHVLVLHARCGLALDDGTFLDGPGELLRQATMAAKSATVDGVPAVFSATTHAELQAAVTLEADLHQALERDEFFLLYQPLVSTTTGRIESLEALVRWQHPVRGLVPPDAFIGAAERTGQIVRIGLRVLELAVAQLRAWSSGPGSTLTVAVNVSARQLAEPGFVDQVQSVVWAAGVDPHRVLLELTESLLVEDSEQAIAALWQLRSLGFRLALDDFGTGYSSLARLGELPLDELKIDKSFVDRLGVGPTDSTALVTAAIAMGHGLGLTVVAEGVESATQAAHLTALSCDLLQGYLLGKPQSIDALTPQLRQNLLADAGGIPEPRAADTASSVHVPQLVPDSVRR